MGVTAQARGAFLANRSERWRGSTMRTENVLDEFERAKKSLAAARLLLSSSLFEDAVSRSYYAVMHATKSALLVHDVITDSHARVRRLFGSVLVRPGLIEKEWAAILGRQQDKRAVADYGALLGIRKMLRV
jgi:uncharacterized protein (UPF0332 family)